MHSNLKIGKQIKHGGTGIVSNKLRRYVAMSHRIITALKYAFIIGFILFAIWSQNNLIITKEYIYTNPKIPKTFTGYTIAHISDLHNTGLNVVRAVKRSDPDIVVVSGDLTSDDGKYHNSVDILNELAKHYEVYIVFGEYDTDLVGLTSALSPSITVLENISVDLKATNINTDAFINEYIEKGVLKAFGEGDKDAIDYIEYTKKTLSEHADKVIRLSGLPCDVNSGTLIEDVYEFIGTDKSLFQIMAGHRAELFDIVKLVDVDLYLSGHTHGKDDVTLGYKRGTYASQGTTMFLSNGIGKISGEGTRILNYPSVTKIVLSDGTLREYNPLEKVLMHIMPNNSSQFNDDIGYREYKYTKEIENQED